MFVEQNISVCVCVFFLTFGQEMHLPKEALK